MYLSQISHYIKVGIGQQTLQILTCVFVIYRYKRDSLKILGTVGEPINPEAWLWYHRVVGSSKCVIVDTFWQTETVSSWWG